MFLREPSINENYNINQRRTLPKMIGNFEQTKFRELRGSIPKESACLEHRQNLGENGCQKRQDCLSSKSNHEQIKG